MKLIQLQYFLEIAECKSITKAAERLFVSQPAVTKQMNQLEDELGVKLMQRTPSGIVLTETGAEFAKDCRGVIRDLDKAITKAVNAGKKDFGILRIGCFDGAVVEDFLPDLYAYFRKTAPGMQIKLVRQAMSQNRKALEEDSIDMLIELQFPSVGEDDQMKQHCAKTLAVREGAFIYSEQSPLAKKKKLQLKDFAKETCFLLSQKEEAMLVKPGLITLRKLQLDPQTEEVDNFVTLMSNIRLGLGYSPLSKQAVNAYPDLRAFELPSGMGLEVVARWKKETRYVTELMKRYK